MLSLYNSAARTEPALTEDVAANMDVINDDQQDRFDAELLKKQNAKRLSNLDERGSKQSSEDFNVHEQNMPISVNITDPLVEELKDDTLPKAEKADQPSMKRDYAQDIELMKKYLEQLPQKNRPADMTKALEMIKDGAMVAELVHKRNFYDAIMMSREQNFSEQDTVVLKSAFNTSDLEFWNLIKDDKELAAKAGRHAIPFTLKALESVESAMYFRSTYARMRIGIATMEEFAHAYQAAIVQLQWHLYTHAVLQDKGVFSSGMITVEDRQSDMFKFLDGYAELVSPKYKLHNSVSFHSLTTTKAYTRKSSHYNGAKKFKNDFGIDIQDSKNRPLSILPGNKSHILFGLKDNGMLFVKWENYGVTVNPRQKDMSILPHLQGYFHKKDIQDDPVLERREKVTSDVMNKFESLYGKKKSLSSKQKKAIEAYGISYMIKELNPIAAQEFKDYLITVKGYSEKSLSVRKGNEIILHQTE